LRNKVSQVKLAVALVMVISPQSAASPPAAAAILRNHARHGRLFWLLEVVRQVIMPLRNHVRLCRRVPERSLAMSSRRTLFVSCLVVVALAGAFSAIGAPAPAEPGKPKDGPLGMKFVSLPKGTFYMGWNGEKGSAKKTEITEDFEIAIHTVTQGQWQEVMGKNPSYFSRDGDGKEKVKDIKDEDLKHFPVERVSWDDAQEFIKTLNENEKGRGYLYRLPSEAEWEYACRGGATSEEECSYQFYFEKPTNDLSSTQANFNGDHPFGKGEKGPYLGRTTKVGSYAPNKLGLYDMHGNVWQWCEDLYEKGASDRVDRGGGWFSVAGLCRAALRFGGTPDDRDYSLGFRLARVPVRAQNK
jgi:formylglycine-generating enzyme required for sulfatase activity